MQSVHARMCGLVSILSVLVQSRAYIFEYPTQLPCLDTSIQYSNCHSFLLSAARLVCRNEQHYQQYKTVLFSGF